MIPVKKDLNDHGHSSSFAQELIIINFNHGNRQLETNQRFNDAICSNYLYCMVSQSATFVMETSSLETDGSCTTQIICCRASNPCNSYVSMCTDRVHVPASQPLKRPLPPLPSSQGHCHWDKYSCHALLDTQVGSIHSVVAQPNPGTAMRTPVRPMTFLD